MVGTAPTNFTEGLGSTLSTLLHSLGSCWIPSRGAAKQTGLVLDRKTVLERSSLGQSLLWAVGRGAVCLLWVLLTPTPWSLFGKSAELGGK